jgi:hypothetical protein
MKKDKDMYYVREDELIPVAVQGSQEKKDETLFISDGQQL